MSPHVAVAIPLPARPDEALACLQAVAALPEVPAHDVVLLDASAGQLDALLARVDGDVTVVRSPEEGGPAAALRHAAEAGTHTVLAVLDEGIVPQGNWLAPLVAELDDPAAAGATSVLRGGAPGVRALAVRRSALPRTIAGPLETLALAAAAHGAVRPASMSVVAPLPRRTPVDPGSPLELSIVIPTLDAGSPRMAACVAAIAEATDAAHEIVVVHNGAPAQGFSAPVNSGLRAARAPYVVVMNDDVEPLLGWWPPLRAALDDGAAVAFPRTVAGFDRTDFAAWCFAMTREGIDRHTVAEGEFFDPELVVHFQDRDLYHRLVAAGSPPVVVPEAAIRHGLSLSLTTDDRPLRAWIEDQIRKDLEAFERKHPELAANLRFAPTR